MAKETRKHTSNHKGFVKGDDNSRNWKKDWTAEGLYAELMKLDCGNYDEVINALMKLQFDKLVYIATRGTKLPTYIKVLATALLTDTQNGQGKMLNALMDRLIGKVSISNEQPTNSNIQISVEVENNETQQALNAILNEDNTNIQ